MTEIPGADLSVLVVWEPVILTDRYPPTTRVLSRLSDPRVRQFWDQGRLLSGVIAKAAESDPQGVLGQEEAEAGTIVWDFVAIYPAGVVWRDEFPAAAFVAAPVVDAVDHVRQHLRIEGKRPTARRAAEPCGAFGG